MATLEEISAAYAWSDHPEGIRLVETDREALVHPRGLATRDALLAEWPDHGGLIERLTPR